MRVYTYVRLTELAVIYLLVSTYEYLKLESNTPLADSDKFCILYMGETNLQHPKLFVMGMKEKVNKKNYIENNRSSHNILFPIDYICINNRT